ncbi:DUF2798 domain-containing protein [Glaciimonas sp. CA11.2]|uniref:DUF2798 domain-containing protein n=1 Tax=unclassified Glaciimonas TaxID=2644401 RepID=UPI002AB38CBE|nr:MULTISPECIES: DUF2798 domain-containing protein [unclassified Glaciimonas]MDY7546044.1 DUF2798 domain-containing protein [Glaciimonas sp. CA11.2]MEB0012106.1 DUF2798 domain-containing protein [Glaciimonas sp. Cout2]MEB0083862.1 DUF2798 domain-containing protein [Glaciimonas sp. Gout2]MEB0163719.1 DUF2798 domain-containing protein [Glaciimonas sp. CA11.2]
MGRHTYSDREQQFASIDKRQIAIRPPKPNANAWPKSRSLASMLPSFVLSCVLTGLMSALMRLMWFGVEGHFFSTWIENWLTLWPIAFPIMYVLHAPLQKLAAYISPHSTV